MRHRFVPFIKKYRFYVGFFVYSLLCWVWLLEVDVAQLASSSAAGKFMQLMVLVFITVLSTVLYAKSTQLLLGSLARTSKWLVPIKLAMWWAATEMLVAWAVSIIWYGEGARLDNILPFTSLSHLGIWTPLGYLTRFVGIYGLSGLLFMLFMLAIKKELRGSFLPALGMVVVLTVLAWGAYRNPSGPNATVVVVSEQSEQDKLQDTVQAKTGSLVVFPEYGFNGIESDTVATKIESQTSNENVYFVGSRFIYEEGKLKNQLVAGDSKNGFLYEIDKKRLIPMGEYVPYIAEVLLRLTGAKNVVDNFKATRQVATSDKAPQQMLLELGVFRVGAGICSSIIAPEDYRKLTKNGANILTNSAFLGVFNGSPIYDWHHRSMAKLMATANARPFLQSANSGSSFGFDSNGNELFNIDSSGLTEFQVGLNSNKTLYSVVGEYIAAGGVVWIIGSIFYSRKMR